MSAIGIEVFSDGLCIQRALRRPVEAAPRDYEGKLWMMQRGRRVRTRDAKESTTGAASGRTCRSLLFVFIGDRLKDASKCTASTAETTSDGLCRAEQETDDVADQLLA